MLPHWLTEKFKEVQFVSTGNDNCHKDKTVCLLTERLLQGTGLVQGADAPKVSSHSLGSTACETWIVPFLTP